VALLVYAHTPASSDPHAGGARLRARIARRLWPWLCAAGLWALPLTAARAAPGVALDQYRAPALSSDGFATARPEVGPHLQFEARLSLNYAHDPLVFENTRGSQQSEKVALVSDQLVAQLGVSLALIDHLLLFTSLPINLVMAGTPLGSQPTATGFGAGDLGLGVRGLIVRGEAGALGLELSGTLPTAADSGDTPAVAGDHGPTLSPALLGEALLGPLRVSASAGLRFRKAVTLPGARFSNQVTYALALSLPLAAELLRAQAELFGSTLSSDAGLRQSSPLEALLGLKLRPNEGWAFGLSGGMGLLRGYGAPDFRLIAQLAWHTPGAAAHSPASEPAPAVAKPVAPPPIAAAAPVHVEPPKPPDFDHDGLLDEDDACPALPGTAALSGCPAHIAYAKDSGALTLTPAPSFSRKTSELSTRNLSGLESLAAALANDQGLRVSVAVHLDARSKGNLDQISELRARALAQWLLAKGVAAKQLEAYSCSANRPLTLNKRDHAQNDRVEFFLTLPLPAQGMPSTLGCAAVALQPSASGPSAARSGPRRSLYATFRADAAQRTLTCGSVRRRSTSAQRLAASAHWLECERKRTATCRPRSSLRRRLD
jgi:outer membrane protein OmpA-like peptidoglycan-associated protein